jgi:hypothetical protein
MLHTHSLVHTGLRNACRPATVTAVVAALLLVGQTAGAAVRLLTTVPVPVSSTNTTGGMYSFDISWVDRTTGTYYLADRSNQAVDVVEAETFITQLTGDFAGFTPCSPPAGANDCAGPNGVATSANCLFVTDAPSRVVSFDKATLTLVNSVQTDPTDPTRADELAVDPRDALILAINNASKPPYGTLITFDATTCTLTPPTPATNRIIFDAAHGVDATNGAEQPVWDPGTQKFYLSMPEISGDGGTNLHGAVLRIAPTGEVEAQYPVDFCGPAGLAVGPNEQLLVGCNTIFDELGNKWTGNADRETHTAAPQYVILDAVTGTPVANVLGVGVGDEVWFNPGDEQYYTAASGSPLAPNAITPARPPVGNATTAPVLTAQGAAILGVIDASSNILEQLVPTLNVPAVAAPQPNPHPAATAHSVAANAATNHVFVPLGANNVFPDCLTGCIAVYGR